MYTVGLSQRVYDEKVSLGLISQNAPIGGSRGKRGTSPPRQIHPSKKVTQLKFDQLYFFYPGFVKAWKCGAPERAWAVLSMKMRGSGTSLIRFERENANLRNTAANPWHCQTLCVRAEPAVGGDERVEIKENFQNDGLRKGKIRQKM